jgi:hypothetical protein
MVDAVVEQVVMRTRNYLLGVILVRSGALEDRSLAFHFAGLLRSKLRE